MDLLNFVLVATNSTNPEAVSFVAGFNLSCYVLFIFLPLFVVLYGITSLLRYN